MSMWPFSEIKRLRLKIEGLEKKKRELEDELLRRPIDNFHMVAKDFDALSVAGAIRGETLREIQPVFKEHLFKAISRIDYNDARQVGFSPKGYIAETDMVNTYEVEINLPALNYRFQVYNGR